VLLKRENTSCHLHLSYFDSHHFYTIKHLPVVPRVGENFTIPYFRAKVGSDWFYARSIEHQFEDNKQIIYIRLSDGRYNLFWHLRKDEAYLKEEISTHDDYSGEDYELKYSMRLQRYV
jgi:hypothetical protein